MPLEEQPGSKSSSITGVAEPLDSRPAPESIAYSCVMDQDPLMAAQTFIWVNCLLEIQSVPPENVFIHHTGIANADFASWLESRRINLVKIKPFDARSPHCNKLQQIATFLRRTFDRIVLMDCDTAWVGHAPLPRGGPVAAKVVDLARPSEAILTGIFHKAGFGDPDWIPVSVPMGPGAQRTDRNNCNGGVYVFDGTVLPQLDAAWRRWADWCLDHRQMFGEFSVNVDQVSLALALRELGLAVDSLPIEWNYPIQPASLLPTAKMPDVTPQILHYHRQIGTYFKIERMGVAKPDQAIQILNERIGGFLSKHFINSVFWNLRYRIDPALGSGIGSRGDFLHAKRHWLGCALGTFLDKKVVDVGCGDLEVMRTQPVKNYVGLDVSQEALVLARAKRRDWRFVHVTEDELDHVQGDAVICLDVLIHQKKASEFDALIRRLVNAAGERLIVSGFNEPLASAETISFHRPLASVLRETGLFSEISVIGKYRDLSLVVADKRRAGAAIHPNDMTAADFNEASLLTRRPDLLRHLVDLSRETFGFYTSHFPRTIEYPWVAEKLEALRPGQHALDIGAGLNPLPLFLARRGVKVDTVDSHPLVRVPPTDATWNEWGFYDYARVHPNLRSHQMNACSFEPEFPLDAIYSVSVIEHMPRATWEAILARCRRWLPKNGRLVLTIDLIPGTESLWNYSEGNVVEPVSVHGNIGDLIRCLDGLGFTPLESFVSEKVPKSRTDLFFIDCVVN
jgi:2-polyprenyl-3-methyl-5-hydroxy-6-metoxy-1,4-benzoquinol methylase